MKHLEIVRLNNLHAKVITYLSQICCTFFCHFNKWSNDYHKLFEIWNCSTNAKSWGVITIHLQIFCGVFRSGLQFEFGKTSSWQNWWRWKLLPGQIVPILAVLNPCNFKAILHSEISLRPQWDTNDSMQTALLYSTKKYKKDLCNNHQLDPHTSWRNRMMVSASKIRD